MSNVVLIVFLVCLCAVGIDELFKEDGRPLIYYALAIIIIHQKLDEVKKK